jgi:tRNA G10  N-methylase Trm11
MKRIIILGALAVLVCAGADAQTMTQSRIENKAAVQTQQKVQNQNKDQLQGMTREQMKEQARIQKQEAKAGKREAKVQTRNQKANQGTAVSGTARNTESGPGKGEAISTQAKTTNEVKQAKPADKGKASDSKAAKGASVKPGKGKVPGRR